MNIGYIDTHLLQSDMRFCSDSANTRRWVHNLYSHICRDVDHFVAVCTTLCLTTCKFYNVNIIFLKRSAELTNYMYIQTCVERPYKRIYVFGFSGRQLLIAA